MFFITEIGFHIISSILHFKLRCSLHIVSGYVFICRILDNNQLNINVKSGLRTG